MARIILECSTETDDITVIYPCDSTSTPRRSRETERKHGVSLDDARAIFDQVYLVDQKNDDPEQFRAIGWCNGHLCSVIFEIRRDSSGEYHHLVTAWRATKEEERSYAENI
jgi:uncharacterized DUF497 family protein